MSETMSIINWIGLSLLAVGTVFAVFWICATLHEISVSLASIAKWLAGANHVRVQMPPMGAKEAGEYAAQVVAEAEKQAGR